jgi:hypothetical protein
MKWKLNTAEQITAYNEYRRNSPWHQMRLRARLRRTIVHDAHWAAREMQSIDRLNDLHLAIMNAVDAENTAAARWGKKGK